MTKTVEGMYEAAFNGAPDALLVVDERGRIVTANAQAEKLFGVPGEQLRRSESTACPR
jgi:PAS domain S-box-containing protein